MSLSGGYEQIAALVEQMRSGSDEAKDGLIEAHLWLAVKTASGFDDEAALSDALFGLVKGVEDFKKSGSSINTLPAYLKVAIQNACLMSVRSERLYRKKLDEAPVKEHVDPEIPVVDLVDQIKACCEDDIDRRMIELRMLHYKYPQIAKVMFCATTTVATRMQRLEQRFSVRRKLAET